MANDLVECKSCPYGGAKVGSRGARSSPVCFVAEAPGHDELKTKFPLTGPSGKVFWNAVPDGEPTVEGEVEVVRDGKKVKVTKQLPQYAAGPYVLNATQCSPRKRKQKKGNSVDPIQVKATQCCHNRLMAQVRSHKRKVIAAMGNFALWSLTGNYDYKITQVRGKLIPHPDAEYGILPIVHPAAILRGTGNYRQFCEDVRYAIHLAYGGEPKTPITPTYYVCDTPEKVRTVIKYALWNKPFVAADIETSSFDPLKGTLRDPRRGHILSLGLAAKADRVYIIPEKQLGHPLLKQFFNKSRTRFIWHNGKFDVRWLRYYGFSARCDEDTMLLSYALDEMGGIHDLEQVASDLLGAVDYKHVVKQYQRKENNRSYEDIPFNVLCKYHAYDVSNTLQIFPLLRDRVKADPALEKLYTRMLIPASETLTTVESRGLYVNIPQVFKNGDKYVGDFKLYLSTRNLKKPTISGGLIAEAHAAFLEAVHKATGDETLSPNPNSPDQMKELLYVKMRLPDKNGGSTDKQALKPFAKLPVVQALQAMRKASKAFSTYVLAVYDNVGPDGRIHATFKIHGTRTGRLSCSDPNLQNIPRDPELRGMFMAAPGYELVEVDLSQAELRSLAALSGDENLCRTYNDPTAMSIHDQTAFDNFGQKYLAEKDKYLKNEMKMIAKNINFGIVYGITEVGLSEQTGRSHAECRQWIDRWFKNRPKAKEFIGKCRMAPALGKTITTCFGRKKRHRIVTREMLQAMQNEASNFPHQSIASDITLESAGIVQPKLRKRDVWIVNLIHDAILSEVPLLKNGKPNIALRAWVIQTISAQMRETPRNRGITRVPFVADAKVGQVWGQLQECDDNGALKQAA